MTMNRRSISVDNYRIPTSLSWRLQLTDVLYQLTITEYRHHWAEDDNEQAFYISWQLQNTDIIEMKMTINRRSISVDNYTIPTSMSWRWQYSDVLYQLTITEYRHLWAEDDNEQTFYISWQLHNTDIYEMKMTINRRSVSVDNYTIPTSMSWRWQWTDVLYQLTITQYRQLWAEDDNEQTFYISWQLHNINMYELKMTMNRRSISVDNYTIPTSMRWRWQ